MKKNKKGFTLAELLIVVAIIGVLVAISIPIFNNQLKKARFATNVANARAAKAAVFATYYDTNELMKCKVYDIKTGTVSDPLYDDAQDYRYADKGGILFAQTWDEPETWTMDLFRHSQKECTVR
ncbi:MAG: prepilin-type N-terminal cleavage/methylation domain-containing protein [Erysipelotrichaceae bacterium]|jgi:prepilin-type N-terminal cleavage/methylation domain-containing protein